MPLPKITIADEKIINRNENLSTSFLKNLLKNFFLLKPIDLIKNKNLIIKNFKIILVGGIDESLKI